MKRNRIPPTLIPIRKLLPLISFLLIFLSSQTCIAEIVDRIVAVVNDHAITLTELEEQGKAYFHQVNEKTPPESHKEALQRARMEVLEGLIERSLVGQKAKSMNIEVSAEEVANTYSMMVAKSGLSEKAFLEKLNSTGHSETIYKRNLKSQILQGRLVTQDVRSKVVITEKMMQDHYNKKYLQEGMPAGYHLMQMGFTWDNTPESQESTTKSHGDKLDAEKRAKHVLTLAQNGQDFKKLAKKFSDLPSASDGGDIGIFEADDMAPFMRESVITLKAGEISPILETPMAFQFFKLLSTVDGNATSFEAVREDIREELYDLKLNVEFNEWVKELKENAIIKRLL